MLKQRLEILETSAFTLAAADRSSEEGCARKRLKDSEIFWITRNHDAAQFVNNLHPDPISTAKKYDHVFEVCNLTDEGLGGAPGKAPFGGLRMKIAEASLEASENLTSVHELGHSLGLYHPDVDGNFGHGKSPDNPIKNLTVDNFMGYKPDNQKKQNDKVDIRQVLLMEHFFKNNDLNGAHYKEGTSEWSDPQKDMLDIFGIKRFDNKEFKPK